MQVVLNLISVIDDTNVTSYCICSAKRVFSKGVEIFGTGFATNARFEEFSHHPWDFLHRHYLHRFIISECQYPMSTSMGVTAETWDLIAQSRIPRDVAARVLEKIRNRFPIQSFHLFAFDAVEKRVVGLISASTNTLEQALPSLECTDARWMEFGSWLAEKKLLRQHGRKRAGKLAWLTPDSVTGEVIGLPLCRRVGGLGSQAGAVVFELASDRMMPDEAVDELESLAGPFWFWLQALSSSQNEAERLADTTMDASAKKSADQVIGADGGLKSVMERVELVSPSDMPVLILGDTGTGKEVVARSIHQRSSRAGRPFIRVNCGAIPTELIDSQLFGHERGSFTGASDQRKGWFERADGGTLFLDEIGELPLAAQVRLLRVLQDHQIERVGGQESIHIDVRIIAATHRDLAGMVHNRTFREDLWYRINMFPILLPRLCERLEDIPALARHFVNKAAANFGLPTVELTLQDIKQLIEYSWPGNIREMQAVIDRAVILGRGTRLDIENALGIGISQRYEPPVDSDEPTYYEVIPEDSYRRKASTVDARSARLEDQGEILSLDEAVRRHIERALVIANGQIEGKKGAAKLLEINPHTLRAKMRKLGIEWDRFRTS